MRTLLLLVVAITLAAPAVAADAVVPRDAAAAPAVRSLPFPRTERAAAAWDERTCWSRCGAFCAWGMTNCLSRDAQGACLARADHCDRACLRNCRSMGGPYVPDIFDF